MFLIITPFKKCDTHHNFLKYLTLEFGEMCIHKTDRQATVVNLTGKWSCHGEQ